MSAQGDQRSSGRGIQVGPSSELKLLRLGVRDRRSSADDATRAERRIAPMEVRQGSEPWANHASLRGLVAACRAHLLDRCFAPLFLSDLLDLRLLRLRQSLQKSEVLPLEPHRCAPLRRDRLRRPPRSTSCLRPAVARGLLGRLWVTNRGAAARSFSSRASSSRTSCWMSATYGKMPCTRACDRRPTVPGRNTPGPPVSCGGVSGAAPSPAHRALHTSRASPRRHRKPLPHRQRLLRTRAGHHHSQRTISRHATTDDAHGEVL